MLLDGEVRGADAAVWRAADLPETRSNRVHRAPPVLAVEVTERDETLELLREKAAWYLEHGVLLVWLLDPASRMVIVLTGSGEESYGPRARIPEHPALPGLSPRVDDLFAQVDG
jgi:Uma2 family endonuclease